MAKETKTKTTRMVPMERIIGGVERFSCYVASKDETKKPKRRLALEQSLYQPFVCSTLEQFMHYGIETPGSEPRKIPLAFLMCTKEQVLQDDPGFFVPYVTYIALSPSQVIPYYHGLPPERQNLATFAYADAPVHIFFDLDWDEDERGKLPFRFQTVAELACIQLALISVLRRAFVSSFRREPLGLDSDKSMHWESACTKSKLSLHPHLISEAFASRTAFETWVKTYLLPFIQREATKEDPDPDATYLGAVVSKSSSRDFGKWKCLLDESVTCKNHLLRLCGNRKPGGVALKWIPSPLSAGSSTGPSEDELLFRSLICYAIAAPRDRWLEFSRTSSSSGSVTKTVIQSCQFVQPFPAQPIQQAKDDTKQQPSLQNKPTSEQWSWIQSIRIPWFDQRGLAQPEAVQFGITNDGYPYVRYQQKQTPCPVCTERRGQLMVHSSNHCFLTVNPKTGMCSFGSTDSNCKEQRIRFSLPWPVAQRLRMRDMYHLQWDTSAVLPLDIDLEKEPVEDPVEFARRYYGKNQNGKRPREDKDEKESKQATVPATTGFASPFDQCDAWFQRMKRTVSAKSEESEDQSAPFAKRRRTMAST